MQLIKYRYNALCGNANWIRASATLEDVRVRIYPRLRMLVRKMHGGYYGQGRA